MSETSRRESESGTTGRESFAEGHVREAQGLEISSVGFGTRLGVADDETDERYRNALLEGARGGCNLFDTGCDYRDGRSESVLGRVLDELRRSGDLFAAPVVCTKSGTFGGAEDLNERIARSRDRLGSDRIDVYYLEDLESHLRSGGSKPLDEILPHAFETLEKARREGRIRFFGISSSSGLLNEPDDEDYLSLKTLVETSRKVGGEEHGLRFVQTPYSITRPEALTARNQLAGEASESLIQASIVFGLSFIAAESLASGRTLGEDHPWLSGALPASDTLAQRALQFVRSTPGVAAALVGTVRTEHAAEDAVLSRLPTMSRERFRELVPKEAPQLPWLY